MDYSDHVLTYCDYLADRVCDHDDCDAAEAMIACANADPVQTEHARRLLREAAREAWIDGDIMRDYDPQT